MKRILFLDIDGVLRPSHEREFEMVGKEMQFTGKRLLFNPGCVGWLNAITLLTGAQIVVHSSWRDARPTVKGLAKWLRSEGVTGTVIGRTPQWEEIKSKVDGSVADKGLHFIGQEIQWWLERHRPCDYVIVDDSSGGAFLKNQQYHFTRTNPEIGLNRDSFVGILALFNMQRTTEAFWNRLAEECIA